MSGALTTRPTMRDVAHAAGVSLKTVSRVVNGEPGVSPQTHARVGAAITRLGFRRNDLARSLRRNRSSTLGLVVGDVGNPFFSAIARAFEEVARTREHMVVTASSNEDPLYEQELVGALCARRVDGLVLVPAGRRHRYLLRELAAGIPVVFADRPPGDIAADAVVLDDVGGARRGVQHLLRAGHRRIGLLADDVTIHTARQRIKGYHDALRGAGLEVDDTLVRAGCRDVAEAEEATGWLLDLPRPPTALFAVNNRMSLGALRAVHARGSTTALVGFDDLEFVDMLSTPLTVVAHDPEAMGRTAAEMLFARLDGDTAPARQVVLPTVLRGGSGSVVRPDSACPGGGAPQERHGVLRHPRRQP